MTVEKTKQSKPHQKTADLLEPAPTVVETCNTIEVPRISLL